MVEAARIAYRDYPTVVNEIPESGIIYDNSKCAYSEMDSKLQTAQKSIGGSSDSAQLALSYYYSNKNKGIDNEETKELYDNTIILAVLAQIAIDGCKRLYAVDPVDEIKRIRDMDCMKRKKDFPKFMVYTHDIPVTKNGKERPYEEIKKDRNKVKNRVDKDIICPMNWLQECLDKIQGAQRSNAIETINYLVDKPNKYITKPHISKIRKLVEEYDHNIRVIYAINIENKDLFILQETDKVIKEISRMKISYATMYNLVKTSLGYSGKTNINRKYDATKYTLRMLQLLYKYNKNTFLSCFIQKNNRI